MKKQMGLLAALLLLAVGQPFAQVEEFRPMEPIEPLPSLTEPPRLDQNLDLRNNVGADQNFEVQRPVQMVPPPPHEVREEQPDCDVAKQECENFCVPLPTKYPSYRECAIKLCRTVREDCLEAIIDDLRERGR